MNIGIYLYDQAEVLDFSGPFEVFSTAKRLGANHWQVFLIADQSRPVTGRGGFAVMPHFTIEDHPRLDVLMVVGGVHNEELKKLPVMSWIAEQAPQCQWLVSVCTGAFLLAEAGLLNDIEVTTHWEDADDLQHQYPALHVLKGRRWVQDGKVITSAGISAGLDISLHLVALLESMELARKTARQMDYSWQDSRE